MCEHCGCGQPPDHHGAGVRTISVEEDLLAHDRAHAEALRARLAALDARLVNVIGSPGCGKTALLTRLIPLLDPAHTCAVVEGGDVVCWGYGEWGVLGYGNTAHGCTYTEGGGDPPFEVYSCQEDGHCCIGDNEFPSAAGLVEVGGSVRQVAAASLHTCALLRTGAVRCWGAGVSGSLGYGNEDDIGDNEDPESAGDVPVW